MYCTGGIRCEKATSYLLERGFSDVFHLKGGILHYLESVPEEESLWSGECFVFDQPAALGHRLETTTASICNHLLAAGDGARATIGTRQHRRRELPKLFRLKVRRAASPLPPAAATDCARKGTRRRTYGASRRKSEVVDIEQRALSPTTLIWTALTRQTSAFTTGRAWPQHKFQRTTLLSLLSASEGVFLIVRQNKNNRWYLPGGRVEQGEELPLAAAQQCLRETGSPSCRRHCSCSAYTSREDGKARVRTIFTAYQVRYRTQDKRRSTLCPSRVGHP